MPEYLSPGVYIEEVNNGPRPIESVGTAMAAFVGFAPAGPANKPRLVTNWTQYVETFGSIEEGGSRNPHLSGAYLSHAVYGYFLNGGSRCYVTRVVPPSGAGKSEKSVAQLPSRSSKAVPSLTFTPKADATSDIQIEVLPPSGEAPAEGSFTLKIHMGEVEEIYENVNLGKKGSPVAEKVNTASKLVAVAEATGAGSLIDRAPEIGNYLLKASVATETPQVQAPHFVGSVVERSGLEGLEIAEDVTMVCCPDLMSAFVSGAIDRDGVKAVQLAMIAHCERAADRVAILDPLPDLSPQDVKRWREVEAGYDSMFATLYYPWIQIMNPADGKPMSVPPCGHIAGVWARNDSERGVHKAPANEVVRGALEPSTQITKGEQDTLNPNGVNCIRTFTGRGVRVWGARTLSSDPAWRYVSVRRMFNMVEKSIERATQWVVFEPNDQNLWARLRRDVGAYLTTVWRDGMLFGGSPAEAFYVKCDEELNPAEIRDQGRLIIEVGMAPVKPAEFVVFRFSQMSGGGA
jgi:phage tail sheath protein FI